MCRSKDKGGRRCPGSATSRRRAPRAQKTATSRRRAVPGARAAWREAQTALDEAKKALDPRELGNPAYLLLGPLSRQAAIRAGGGDPSVYDEDVELGRSMLISRLVEGGDDPDTAAAKTDNLANAYARWSETPEA